MRVYHFINKQYGLENIEKRRLKVARIDQLNDPFEWQALTSADPNKRRAIAEMKDEAAQKTGLLCFSRSWKNPVQWSHYADNHRGLCLGFDVQDHLLGKVRYAKKRIDVDWIIAPLDDNEGNERMRQALVTKFKHWSYEEEERVFVDLKAEADVKGLHFLDFSDELVLAEVIVGANSCVSRADLTQALGPSNESVRCRKARLAFKTFSVVEQQKASLWE